MLARRSRTAYTGRPRCSLDRAGHTGVPRSSEPTHDRVDGPRTHGICSRLLSRETPAAPSLDTGARVGSARGARRPRPARGARAGVTKPTARANEVYGVRTGPAASGHTGRSPESANAPFRACEAPELRQTAFPDLQGRHACRSRTRGFRGPRPAYSEVLMPGFPTGSAYERRSGTDRREGTSRRVF